MLTPQPTTPATRRPHLAAATNLLALEASEARAGAYRLGYDHLAIVVGNYLATLDAWYTGKGTLAAHEQALDEVRHTLTRDIDSYLHTPDHCRCTWLGVGTPKHPRNSLCLTPEQDHNNRIRFAAASSVPPVARGEAPQTIADARTARAVLGPLRQVAPDDVAGLPADGQWGPYEVEDEAQLEPLPVAVYELYDAALVRPGDPEGVASNVVLAHLVATCEAVRIRRGAFDDRVLEWLARGEPVTAQALIGMIRRAFAAGAAAATIEQLAREPIS
ncbi:hypothetical protein [Actinoplanes sp. CA-252034]|uniref:hypothetical protein n=1 Tax=Actinoplanes sp. CA-252034 TaxID=3239906 RepID=UPI003D96A253